MKLCARILDMDAAVDLRAYTQTLWNCLVLEWDIEILTAEHGSCYIKSCYYWPQ